MKSGDRVGEYVLERPLGKREGGSAWTATSSSRPAPDDEVVVKVLDIGEAQGWSLVDLMRREAAALRALSHPGIPRLLDDFEDSSDGKVRLVLVMERVPGIDLESAVEAGRSFSDAEVERILADLAGILAYLGSRRPPVVHRDVNPKNVILRPDGGIALVDFSCAQDAARRAAGRGATLVGTAGYIPVEQVAGKATHRSDLFAAAATAVFLLARCNPAELPAKGMKPDIESLGPISPRLRYVLDSWLEPYEPQRGLEAAAAASILRGETRLPERAPTSRPPFSEAADFAARVPASARDRGSRPLPSDSRVAIEGTEAGLRISIPPAGIANPLALGIGGFSVFWLGFVAFWTFSAIAMGAPFFFVLFSLPFWLVGIGLAKTVLATAFGRLEIEVDESSGFTWKERVIGKGAVKRWPLSDLDRISLERASVRASGSDAKELVIEAGASKLRLGRGLTERELLAIKDAIEERLARTINIEAPLPNTLARD